jgi:hypothetical protein
MAGSDNDSMAGSDNSVDETAGLDNSDMDKHSSGNRLSEGTSVSLKGHTLGNRSTTWRWRGFKSVVPPHKRKPYAAASRHDPSGSTHSRLETKVGITGNKSLDDTSVVLKRVCHGVKAELPGTNLDLGYLRMLADSHLTQLDIDISSMEAQLVVLRRQRRQLRDYKKDLSLEL